MLSRASVDSGTHFRFPSGPRAECWPQNEMGETEETGQPQDTQETAEEEPPGHSDCQPRRPGRGRFNGYA